jgi:streptomycin 6-kinase
LPDRRNSETDRFVFVTDAFKQRVRGAFGAEGGQWLRRLPVTVDTFVRRWSLSSIRPIPDLSYNYVATATTNDGVPVVLKLGVPQRELQTEIDALQHFDGQGCVRLLKADGARGALLLERLLPGSTLADVAATDDAEATALAAGVMRRLWRNAPAGSDFPTVAQWGLGFGRISAAHHNSSGPLPQPLFDHAERLYGALAASQALPVLLHGDLHHWNILAAQRTPWLAIDPKGVLGEPAYEVGAFLRNPLNAIADPAKTLRRRIDQLADQLALDRQRLAGWGFATAILSACWSVEDGGDPAWGIHVARHLYALL